MVMGFFGGGIDRLRRKVRPTETIGSSGTVVLAGFIQHNEKNANVRDTARWRTYSDNLANIDVVGASVRYYLNLGTAAKWSLDPADDTPAAQDVADFIDDVIRDMRTPWARVVRRGLMYRYWGFGIQEWTAKKREDGKIGLLDVEARPAHTIERWDRDEDTGHVVGVVQLRPQDQKLAYLPRTKIVYVVDDSLSDSPDGFGIARQISETVQRLQRFQELETIGFETELRGIPKGRAPYAVLDDLKAKKKIKESERVAILAPLKDFIENHIISVKTGVMIDSSVYRATDEGKTPSATPLWDVELMTGGSTGMEAVAAAIERLQREIARLFGTEGILLGGSNVGSLALSRDKSHQLAVVVDSALSELKEAYQRDIVETVCTLNGIPRELWPTLSPEEMQYHDIEQLTTALGDLATAGAPLAINDPAVNVIRSQMGLPDAPEEDAVDASGRSDHLPGDPDPDPDPDLDPEPDPDDE
jgi:hypothetical protein